MIRILISFHLLLIIALAVPALAAPPSASPSRILLVVSSHGRDNGETQPGFEMDELTQTWAVLSANGFALDIASPAGGAVVADGFDPAKAYNAAFLADPLAKAKLGETLQLSANMAEPYVAVVVIGGKGAMFDLPFSQTLHGLIRHVYDRGGVIGAVCHGPALFARISSTDGKPFLAGRRVTGFTDEEEGLFGKRWIAGFPFLLESELRRQGAIFGEAAIMLPHVEIDGRIITGQNPYSVAATSEAIVRALGRTPASRIAWPDERAMELVKRFLGGDRTGASAALASNPADHDPALIAIWGYYRAQQPSLSNAELEEAIGVMEMARPHFPEPQLDAAIAAAKQKRAALPAQ